VFLFVLDAQMAWLGAMLMKNKHINIVCASFPRCKEGSPPFQKRGLRWAKTLQTGLCWRRSMLCSELWAVGAHTAQPRGVHSQLPSQHRARA
jgi:hypothetical protein